MRSVKLAVVLLIILTLILIISTWQVGILRSPIFLLPLALFFINLSYCTLYRLKKTITGKVKKFGPDILHIGLLIIIIGGTISALVRDEASFYMETGQVVHLPNDYKVALHDFKFLKYDDGTPKDWISTVEVRKGETIIYDTVDIEVNHPLKIGSMKLYQASYHESPTGQFLSGIQIVIDLGYYTVFVGLVLLGVGLLVTYIQKIYTC